MFTLLHGESRNSVASEVKLRLTRRGDARPDSDVDLCLVAKGAERQLQAAQQFRHAMMDIRGKPSLTLIPISPRRLEEKKAVGDSGTEQISLGAIGPRAGRAALEKMGAPEGRAAGPS